MQSARAQGGRPNSRSNELAMGPQKEQDTAFQKLRKCACTHVRTRNLSRPGVQINQYCDLPRLRITSLAPAGAAAGDEYSKLELWLHSPCTCRSA